MQVKNKMIDAICHEISLQKDYLDNDVVETIYFGGGTPSVLSANEIEKIMSAIFKNFKTDLKEITLEANPDDLTYEKLIAIKSAGINRLSIGVQSFFDADLIWMHRAHNAEQSFACIENALAISFNNISVDLIYGIPNQSDDNWNFNIQKLVDYDIPHISCYALTVEPKTELFNRIKKNKQPPPDEEQASRNFLQLMQLLQNNNYEHYEISNFARNKKYAMHNTSYWKGTHYLGIGPSAHSYNTNSRQWNLANNALYMKNLESETIPFEKEILNATEKANEKIMISLRTMWGLDLDAFRKTVTDKQYREFLMAVKVHRQKENLEIKNNHLFISQKAKFFADGVISDLFFE